MRELICNAVDEHITHKVNRLVEVHVPSAEEPWFSVRDFAKGLSKDSIFNIFFQYFTSTKKNDKTTAGFFGIGSKSWAAISDTVIVTSWHEGTKSVYAGIVTGEHSEGHLNSVEPSDEPSGIEVLINIEPNKVYNFRSRFKMFYNVYRNYFPLELSNFEEIPDDSKVTGLYAGDIVNSSFYNQQTSICFKGVLYEVPWVIPNINSIVSIKVNDNVNIDLHPSRERIQDTEKNRGVLNILFDNARTASITEFEKLVPDDFLARWKFCLDNSNRISFLRSCGGKTIPTMSRSLDFSTKSFTFFRVEDGKFKKQKNNWNDESFMTIASSHTKVYFISQLNSATVGMKRTFDALLGEDEDDYYVMVRRDEKLTFQDAQDLFESHYKGSSGLVEDKSDLIPTKLPPKPKQTVAQDVRFYDFKDEQFRQMYVRKHQTYYWLPIINDGELQVKSFTKTEVKSAGIVIIGLNRNNRQNLPENFKDATPILKAMRRHAHKAKDWSLAQVIPTNNELEDNYRFSFLNLAVKQDVVWPFKPKKKIFISEKVKESNRKAIKINDLAENNYEFHALVIARNNSSKFAGQIQDRMLELING